MGLTGHRRTSSHKRRRASHFALTKPAIATDKAGRTHFMHKAAPGAAEYNGIAVHVKGRDRKLAKMVAKTKPHNHDDHEGHDHEKESK